jgi:hypothetical protein
MRRSWARRIARVILITALALPLMVPGLALAGSGRDLAPSAPSARYDANAETPAPQTQTGESEQRAIDDRLVGGLPLTGLDMMILTAAAVSLAAIATAVRILSRPRLIGEDGSAEAAPAPSPVFAVAEAQRSGSPPHAG